MEKVGEEPQQESLRRGALVISLTEQEWKAQKKANGKGKRTESNGEKDQEERETNLTMRLGADLHTGNPAWGERENERRKKGGAWAKNDEGGSHAPECGWKDAGHRGDQGEKTDQ